MNGVRMINLTGELNRASRGKICPLMPPTVYTKVVNDCSGAVTETQAIPIACFGEDCAFFCELHVMCIHKCEHLEMIHGVEDE